MPEVQSHGFFWENELKTKVYGAKPDELKTIKYTNKFDLPSAFNRLDSSCNLSIKTTKSPNTVCMADCLRLYDAVSSNEPLHLVVVFFKQCPNNTKNVASIVEVDLTNSRELLFGTLTRAQLKELDDAVKSVPQKRKPTSEEHKKIYDMKKALRTGAIILNIKCNSTQSRLQCSFNKFQSFLQENPSLIVAKSDTNHFRGGVISEVYTSAPRVFKKSQK